MLIRSRECLEPRSDPTRLGSYHTLDQRTRGRPDGDERLAGLRRLADLSTLALSLRHHVGRLARRRIAMALRDHVGVGREFPRLPRAEFGFRTTAPQTVADHSQNARKRSCRRIAWHPQS